MSSTRKDSKLRARAAARASGNADRAAAVARDAPRDRVPLPQWAAACFLASGAAGLLYEVAWFKQLSYVLGTTLHAATAVVTAFLLGLALGAITLGVRLARGRRPARVYGAIEIGVAVAGILSIPALRAIAPIAAAVGGEPGTALFAATRFGAAFIVLMVPALLMGATLPVLVAEFEPRGVGPRLAALYAWNTAGAVIGSCLAGFVLVPELGLLATTAAAAALNLCAGVLALAATRARRSMADERIEGEAGGQSREPSAARTFADDANARGNDAASAAAPAGGAAPASDLAARGAPPLGPRARIGFAVAFGISGFAALVLQIAWMRLFGLVLGGSVYSFAAVLAVYLAGLAAGAGLAARSTRTSSIRTWAGLELGVALAVAGSLFLLRALPEWFLHAVAIERGRWAVRVAVELGLVGVFSSVPCVLLGAAFPLATRLLEARGGGEAAGRAYAVNTAGTVLGTACAGFVLIPRLGIQGTLIAAAFLSIAAALVALAFGAPARAARAWWFAVPVAGVAVGAALRAPAWDAALMSSGVFRPQQIAAIGAGPAARSWRSLADAALGRRVVFYREGLNGSVSVETDSVGRDFALRVGGKVDASTRDMTTQVLIGLLPAAIARRGARTLVIGLGSGVTLSAALAAGAGPTDLVEIESAVIDASRWFRSEGRDPLRDPRVRVVRDDGRAHLERSRTVWDLVVSQPSNPWLAGVNNLFTLDFYRRVRSRLAPDGVFGQWLQIYEVSPRTLASLLASFLAVFPEGHAFVIEDTDLLLIAAPAGRAIDLARLRTPAAIAEIRRAHLAGPEAIAGFYRAPFAALAPLARGATLNRDDRPVVEYRAPLDLVRVEAGEPPLSRSIPSLGFDAARAWFAAWPREVWWTERVRERLRSQDWEGARSLASAAGAAGMLSLAHELEVETERERRLRASVDAQRIARAAAEAGQLDVAAAALREQIARDSTDGRAWEVLAGVERAAGRLDTARAAAERALAFGDSTDRGDASLVLGSMDAEAGHLAAALARFQKARALNPTSGEAFLFEARAQVLLGDTVAARVTVRRGMTADPRHRGLAEFARSIGATVHAPAP